MLRVLRQRNFALLWVGGLISMVGDWVLFVGLRFEVYRQTGSTLATGGMILALLSRGSHSPRSRASTWTDGIGGV